MRVIQRIQHGTNDVKGLIHFQRRSGPEQLFHRLAFDQRHGVVHQPLALADKMNGDNVGMIQLGEGAGLLLEAGDHAAGPGDLRMEHLDREAAVQIVIEDLVDLGESTSERAAHLELGVPVARRLRTGNSDSKRNGAVDRGRPDRHATGHGPGSQCRGARLG